MQWSCLVEKVSEFWGNCVWAKQTWIGEQFYVEAVVVVVVEVLTRQLENAIRIQTNNIRPLPTPQTRTPSTPSNFNENEINSLRRDSLSESFSNQQQQQKKKKENIVFRFDYFLIFVVVGSRERVRFCTRPPFALVTCVSIDWSR